MFTTFHPNSIMLVPSAACPSACHYCFGPRTGSVMPASVLDASARFIRDELWRGKRAGNITFHGGEPLMAGYEWFERSLGVLAEATRRHVRFSVQSNLWLLNDRFVDLFAEYRVGVSTSLDGGREICDSQRGEGYFDKTMAGIRLLRKNGLDVSAIATVLPENVDKIPDIIDFFDTEGLSFTLRGAEPSLAHGYANYLPAKETGQMYYAVLDCMERNPAPSRIRDVEAAVRNVFSQCSGLCTFSNCLGQYAAISPEGDVYTCQRFCGEKEFRIGTVYDTAGSLQNSAAYKRIAAMYESISQTCSPCKHFKYCNGGCLYSAFVAEKYGKPHPHCNDAEPAGRVYKNLFDHIALKLAAEATNIMLGEKSPTPYLSAAGDKLHPGDIARGRARYAQALKWGATGAPAHAFAKKRGAGKLFLNITDSCPLRCTHCAVNASAGNMDMPLETALTIIREALALGFEEVSLNGGEPFVYGEFRTLVNEMIKMRNADMNFMLFTNLFVDFDDDLAKLILQAFDKISISLDGDEAEHDERRGAGTFTRTCGHLSRLVKLNRQSDKPCALSVRAALTREQKKRGVGEEIRKIAKKHGINVVNITTVLPIGRAKLLEKVTLPIPEPPENPARYFASFTPRDSCGLCSNPHITSEGDIYPCWAYLEEGQPVGNVRDGLQNVLYDFLWGSRKYEYCVNHSEKCKNCDVRYLCGGVCRAYRDCDCRALRAYYLQLGAFENKLSETNN
jgi:uncharacterized protein